MHLTHWAAWHQDLLHLLAAAGLSCSQTEKSEFARKFSFKVPAAPAQREPRNRAAANLRLCWADRRVGAFDLPAIHGPTFGTERCDPAEFFNSREVRFHITVLRGQPDG